MKSRIRSVLWAPGITLLLVLLTSPLGPWSWGSRSLAGPSAFAVSLSLEDISPDSVKMRLAEEVLGNIRIPPALSSEFMDMYNRHRLELDRMVADNPFIIWESLNIALASLPALRAMNENGGMLYLDKTTYSRAMGLVGQCEALASPRLGSDLDKAKRLLMSRTTETNTDQVVIDLSR